MDEVKQTDGENWTMINADCCEAVRELPDASVGMSVFSPPFASLYTYSNSERDMGNCKDSQQFIEHFTFLIDDLRRVIQPGRICAVHCMQLPASKTRDGYIGLKDFRGQIISAFVKAGFIYHSEVTIWKDPVTAMQRTKALGLLHKTIKKDSCMSRNGLPDYLCVFRNPGVNAHPVTHTADTFPVDLWQCYASPVWATIRGETPDHMIEGMSEPGAKFNEFGSPNKDNPDKCGISATDTLQSMADEKDERHICPLQLPVIERAVALWSNPGDVILSPFGGIGSEGYQSLKMSRKYVGIELKESYYHQAVKNLRKCEEEIKSTKLF